MSKLQGITIVLIAFIALAPRLAFATDGVKGQTVRPVQVDAKVKGCKIAKPGDYEVNPGDLIELDYTYPVVPQAIPKKVDFKQTLIGAVAPSPLGIRSVSTPDLVGTGTIAFYFDAKKLGKDIVTLIIDGDEYVYRFTVVKP
jgi:hypothetical protein